MFDEEKELVDELASCGCKVDQDALDRGGALVITFPSGKTFEIFPDNYGDSIGVALTTSEKAGI